MKKILYVLSTIILIFFISFTLVSCSEKDDNFSYEGEILFNGFDSSEDLYRLNQLVKVKNDHWTSYAAKGKIEVVSEIDSVSTESATDLFPRQGEGFLKVQYEKDGFEGLLLRIENSIYSDMPVSKLGGFSVQIFNPSDDEKKVTLSLMSNERTVYSLDSSEFVLKGKSWNLCEVTLNPLIIEHISESVSGFYINFSDKVDSIYYIDNFKISFDQVVTEDVKSLIAEISSIEEQIDHIYNEEITLDKKTELESIYTDYMNLKEGYRMLVTNITELSGVIEKYFELLNTSESSSGTNTILHSDSILGLYEVENAEGVDISYEKDVLGSMYEGCIKLDFDGSTDWVSLDLDLQTTVFDELHVWIKNDSEYRRSVQFNWTTISKAEGCVYNESGEDAGYLVDTKNNIFPSKDEYDGWFEIVLRKGFTFSQLNIASVDLDGVVINSTGSLYIGKITGYRNDGVVTELIENLPDYYEGYPDELKEKVVSTREEYDKLSEKSKNNVSNSKKLFNIEAAIWSECLSDLNLSEVIEYDRKKEIEVESIINSYLSLDEEIQLLLNNEYELLKNIDYIFRNDFINERFYALLDELTVSDVYSLQDIVKINECRKMYDSMSDDNKGLIKRSSLKKLSDMEKVAYKTKRIGNLEYGGYGSDVNKSGEVVHDWTMFSLKLDENLKGSVAFKAKNISNSEGALYLSLFFDGSIDDGQSGDGISIMFNTIYNQVFPYNSGLSTTKMGDIYYDEEYSFVLSYNIESDYSSVDIFILVSDSLGNVVLNASLEGIKEIQTNNFGSVTLKSWLSGHEERLVLGIDNGNSTSLVISDAQEIKEIEEYLPIGIIYNDSDALNDQIENLKLVEDITLSDKDYIYSLKSKYDSLNEEEKKNVSYTTLCSYLDRIYELIADEFESMFSNLPVSDIDSTHREDVKAIRKYYDSLSLEEKEKINETYVLRLEAFEKRLSEIKEYYDISEKYLSLDNLVSTCSSNVLAVSDTEYIDGKNSLEVKLNSWTNFDINLKSSVKGFSEVILYIKNDANAIVNFYCNWKISIESEPQVSNGYSIPSGSGWVKLKFKADGFNELTQFNFILEGSGSGSFYIGKIEYDGEPLKELTDISNNIFIDIVENNQGIAKIIEGNVLEITKEISDSSYFTIDFDSSVKDFTEIHIWLKNCSDNLIAFWPNWKNTEDSLNTGVVAYSDYKEYVFNVDDSFKEFFQLEFTIGPWENGEVKVLISSIKYC